MPKFEGREVFAFTRPGDREAQQFALSLGAAWAGEGAEAGDPSTPDCAEAPGRLAGGGRRGRWERYRRGVVRR